MSLGQGQEVVAEKALDLAAHEGHWVILQVKAQGLVFQLPFFSAYINRPLPNALFLIAVNLHLADLQQPHHGNSVTSCKYANVLVSTVCLTQSHRLPL